MENDEQATSQVVRQISPPIGPAVQLEEVERLKIENMYLRMQNLMLQVQQYDQAKAKAVEEMRGIQTDMENYRAELSLKYGCDVSRVTEGTRK